MYPGTWTDLLKKNFHLLFRLMSIIITKIFRISMNTSGMCSQANKITEVNAWGSCCPFHAKDKTRGAALALAMESALSSNNWTASPKMHWCFLFKKHSLSTASVAQVTSLQKAMVVSKICKRSISVQQQALFLSTVYLVINSNGKSHTHKSFFPSSQKLLSQYKLAFQKNRVEQTDAMDYNSNTFPTVSQRSPLLGPALSRSQVTALLMHLYTHPLQIDIKETTVQKDMRKSTGNLW